jgi:hypothetical protein
MLASSAATISAIPTSPAGRDRGDTYALNRVAAFLAAVVICGLSICG